ncbi:probable serine/threonine-protein kinase At1g54610 [Impatiens glandulifera]|uniref:probable serine/threonine-protein kinase At1g54610 n=1 Tax=Impatiens glandulifera TaxID=253017 RepID=UPI001FB0F7D2|nr:probable serine/threonine-protein kinase At1g54610 [Impatiens glandulifera]
MGCVCGKPSSIEDSKESPRRQRPLSKASSQSQKPGRISSKRSQSFQVNERPDVSGIRIGSIDRKVSHSRRVQQDERSEKKKTDNPEVVLIHAHPAMGLVPKAVEGEQVAAGWPSWLAAEAGEALKGWIPRRADTFEKLDKIGQGTYSSVYKARDLINKNIVALKRVRFDNTDPESIKFMAREILILRRLNHPNIIKLEGLITSRTSCSLYLVFEYMEHDLTGLASLPGSKFSEPQIKCYMQQLLSGLEHCHSNGVLHRDIKGSNLLIDNHGILKIADFGLASFFDHRQNEPLTSRVVTLWYRPPELLLGATHYGVCIDLWSAGCILGELYAGKPIMPGRTEVEQLHKIFKLCGSPSEEYWRKSKLPHSTVFKPLHPYKCRLSEVFDDFPPTAMRLLEKLLSIDPADRGTATAALRSEYFTTKPLPCDPSCLPKYPPSKEMDAKMREDEARRKGGVEGKSKRGGGGESGGPRQHRSTAVPDANAELVSSMQQRRNDQTSNNPKSRSEVFNPHKDEESMGFPLDISTRQTREGKDITGNNNNNWKASYSGPLGLTKSGTRNDNFSIVSARGDLSASSGLVASRNFLPEDCGGDKMAQRISVTGRSESSRKNDRKRNNHKLKGNGRSSTKESNTNGREYMKPDIHFSGPLLVPSNNVDEMLKEHDRRIQEVARRARLAGMVKGKA